MTSHTLLSLTLLYIMFASGIKYFSAAEINDIATDPDHFTTFNATDTDTLQSLVNFLVERTCNVC